MSEYLLSIQSVRERASQVYAKALENRLSNFNVHLDQLDKLVQYVVNIINRDYSSASHIPPHGRWQHFNAAGKDRVAELVAGWSCDDLETSRRLVDLFVVSVLLDAGAGNVWQYTETSTQAVVGRSEGLAIASLYMFKDGLFGPERVDGSSLEKLTLEQLAKGMQSTDINPVAGLEGRLQLLVRLGGALKAHPEYFGADARPGHLVDYLLKHSQDKVVELPILWNALMAGLLPIWPATRTKLDGVALGDAWPLSTISSPDKIMPFHKLTQWLCYSILTPMKKYAGLKFKGESLQTGLPEYRNGGLLVDLGVLTVKPDKVKKAYTVDDDLIVEWRALTISFLDEILKLVNTKLSEPLTLPQLLEAGTWKAGREIAKEKRPDGSPPIEIISDGTVF